MEEIEDIVEEIKYTDSQKSVNTSNGYSQDFTDSSSDKNQSSGKETYVIDQIETDSEGVYCLHSDEGILNLGSKDLAKSKEGGHMKYCRRASVFVENTYTQTSNTVCELRNEVSIQNTVELQHFETQTSFITLTERDNERRIINSKESDETKLKTLYCNSFHDSCSVLRESEVDIDSNGNDNFDRDDQFNDSIHYESKNVLSEYYNHTAEGSTDEESWNVNTDIEEDSLMRKENDQIQQEYSSDMDSDTLESVESDVAGPYESFETVPKASTIAFPDAAICDVSVLTTVTEETNINNSVLDLYQNLNCSNNIQSFKDPHRAARSKFRIQTLFSNSNTNENDTDKLKLPPIYTNLSCVTSPMINPLSSVHNQFQKHHVPSRSTLKDQQTISDRFKYGSKNPASGESPVVYMNHDENKNVDQVQLPPISINVFSNQYNIIETLFSKNEQQNKNQEMRFEEINIKDKIQNLKVNDKKTESEGVRKDNYPSDCSLGEPKVCEVAEKGCDHLCTDIMRRLQSSTWQEITDTLSYLPKSLESFWSIMSEMRIADLLRQIVSLVESPRTQVAQAACEAASHLLIHTNFTKKPDFYEAVSVLLAKTNSYNRVVRRAANLALDGLVSGLHYSHCIAAICVSGVQHKSPLVRCASSRLLIVCCALAEGGRRLLRSRPPSAVAARRHVLRAMAVLLHDRNLETRKYAERLYAILRPLPNFEEYFLSDVDVGLATEHMKKYDHLLPPKNTR